LSFTSIRAAAEGTVSEKLYFVGRSIHTHDQAFYPASVRSAPQIVNEVRLMVLPGKGHGVVNTSNNILVLLLFFLGSFLIAQGRKTIGP